MVYIEHKKTSGNAECVFHLSYCDCFTTAYICQNVANGINTVYGVSTAFQNRC